MDAATMRTVRIDAQGMSAEANFRAIFSRNYGEVFGYAARRVGRDEAADVAAEVFTVAWRKIGSVPPAPETLPWLFGVARRVVSNHRRSQTRRDRVNARANAETSRVVHQNDPTLEGAVASLSESDREILMLVAWEGLGPSDLAAALGCSKNAAVVRLHRARARLVAAWEDERGVE